MKCREIIVTIEENIVAFTDSKDEMIKMRACEMLEKLKGDIMQGVVNL